MHDRLDIAPKSEHNNYNKQYTLLLIKIILVNALTSYPNTSTHQKQSTKYTYHTCITSVLPNANTTSLGMFYAGMGIDSKEKL